MANELSSNVSTRVAKVLIGKFESNRVLTKTVNTSLISGSNGISNETGDTVYLKRPPQYKAIETVDGDISALTKNDIGVGRIPATVQPFITIPIDYKNLEEVTQLNQLQEILAPAAEEAGNKLESNLGKFMLENSGLTYGTPGTGITKWSDVAGMGALMQSVGVPMGSDAFYVMNSFSNSALADAQNGLTAADNLVRTAWENAQISSRFGGLRAMSSNALKTFSSGLVADRVGALGSTPDASWLTHKDTMIQTLNLGGLTISTVGAVKPGDIIEFTGTGGLARSYTNVKNREVVIGSTGTPVTWKCTVVTGGDTDGNGDVTVTVTNAAIYDTAGTNSLDAQFANISAPLTSGDIFTILGAADTIYQPALAYHKNAFALSTLKLPKLHATDTIAMTKDGLSMRITKYSDGDKNLQRWRLDLLPVLGVINPLYAGKGFGTP